MAERAPPLSAMRRRSARNSELVEDLGPEATVEGNPERQRGGGEPDEEQRAAEAWGRPVEDDGPMGGGEDVQRVEALQALEPEWQNILNVDDRCGPEEDLEGHADQLRRVAHEHVEHRGEYAQAEAEGELQCDEGEPEEERRMERMPRQGEREQEHAERERQ